MSESQKDVIYIDVDDEITAIIDKLRESKHKIVALVLPKRCSVLQSIVNMKLLKRTASTHKKNLVLITSEAGLLPLAGAVKLHVAKTLQSKPVIPPEPDVPEANLDVEDGEADDQELDKAESVGALAASATAKSAPPEETIELDNIDDETEDDKALSKQAKKTKKNGKKLKVPDFNRFRKRLFLIGGSLLLVIVLLVTALVVMPKARVIIKTDTLTSNVDVSFTVNTAQKTLDEEKKLVPAEKQEVKKTDTIKVAATGQKNVGEKAQGTMTVFNCTDEEIVVPVGTSFVNNNLSFVTTDAIEVAPSDFFSAASGGACKKNRSKEVGVVAAQSGDNFNLSEGRDYASSIGSTLTGKGSAMSGGTTKNVTVVSQQDIDGTKQQLIDKGKPSALDELNKAFQDDNMMPMSDTMNVAEPSITSSPKVGDESSEVSATSTTTFTMLGVKKDDLNKLLVNAAKKDIDTEKQKITDDGLGKAVFRLVEKKSLTEQRLTVQSTVSTGAQIDEEALKKEIAGKKRGQVQDIIGNRPGVKDVTVDYSPFWVTITPKKASKITLVFEQVQSSNDNSN